MLQPTDAIAKDRGNDISVKRIKGEDCIGVEIDSKDHTETFLFSDKEEIIFGDIRSRSKWVSIVKNKRGEVIKTTSYSQS